jgi:hypothetical protein
MALNEKKKESLPQEEREKYREIFQIARDSFQEQMGRIENLGRKAQINLVINELRGIVRRRTYGPKERIAYKKA